MKLGLAWLVLVLAASGCAGSSAPAPSERQKANAEKQERLQEMLEKGQRN